METGEQIRNWCNSGAEITVADISERIGETKSLQELLELYKQYPQFKAALQPEYENRKRQLIVGNDAKQNLLTQPIHSNGQHIS